MNKLTKITKVGCSALCGSLAVISTANAGELSITGGAEMTYMSKGAATTGNPIGMASAVTFSGSGELDNGWTFALSIAELDGGGYSAANIDIGMGGLGSLNFDQGDSGNGIAAYDNVMPTAWEEAHGAGLSGGVKTVLGSGASQNIMYTAPKMFGTTIALTYAHDYGTTDIADKTTKSSSDGIGSSYDVTVKINPSAGTEILSGLNLYMGASTIENEHGSAQEEDQYQGVGAVTYALGPIEAGFMVSGLYNGQEDVSTGYHSYKNSGYGIAFNVNDDLSISYGQYQSRKAGAAHSDQILNHNVTTEVTSWQAAYTMGGASVRIADVQADNVLFDSTVDQNATIVSLGLAF
jgi:outer membrane protein OmpU